MADTRYEYKFKKSHLDKQEEELLEEKGMLAEGEPESIAYEDSIDKLQIALSKKAQQLFLKIDPKHFPGDKKNPDRHTEAYSHWFNQLTHYVIRDILSKNDPEARGLAMARWLSIVNKCQNQVPVDHFTSSAIIGALNSDSIKRLKIAKEVIPEPLKKVHQEYTTFSLDRTSKIPKSYLNEDDKARQQIPFVGHIQQYLAKKDDQRKLVEDGKDNYNNKAEFEDAREKMAESRDKSYKEGRECLTSYQGRIQDVHFSKTEDNEMDILDDIGAIHIPMITKDMSNSEFDEAMRETRGLEDIYINTSLNLEARGSYEAQSDKDKDKLHDFRDKHVNHLVNSLQDQIKALHDKIDAKERELHAIAEKLDQFAEGRKDSKDTKDCKRKEYAEKISADLTSSSAAAKRGPRLANYKVNVEHDPVLKKGKISGALHGIATAVRGTEKKGELRTYLDEAIEVNRELKALEQRREMYENKNDLAVSSYYSYSSRG